MIIVLKWNGLRDRVPSLAGKAREALKLKASIPYSLGLKMLLMKKIGKRQWTCSGS